MTLESPASYLDLVDWRRQVFALYREIRSADDPIEAWERWKAEREKLFREHPQSPLTPEMQASFTGPHYFDYDLAYRVVGRLQEVEPQHYEITTSGDGTYSFTSFGRVHFSVPAGDQTLEAYWLEGYGGGIFLPFRDETAPGETYGAGRYLLDTVKGADLGATDAGELILDFNFAYNPSCAYDSRWVCPLSTPANRLAVRIEAGEKAPPFHDSSHLS